MEAADYRGEKRILVYGVTGSGKTTFAAKVSAAAGVPWHSVDDLTWEPGWVTVPTDVQIELFRSICGGPEWVLDTAYGTWLDIPLRSADLILALDYPRWLSFARLLRRTICRLFDQRTICNGNRESLKTMFSRESILVWHFKSFSRKRARIQSWLANPPGPRVVVFRTPREAERWVRRLAR